MSVSWGSWGSGAVRDLAAFCTPETCLLCGRASGLIGAEAHLCGDCRHSLGEDQAPTCPHCAATVGPHLDRLPRCSLCRNERFVFDRSYRLGVYHTALKRAVRECKNGYPTGLSWALADLFLLRHEAALQGEQISVVTSVPRSSWWRHLWKWSDPAERLAERLAAGLNRPYVDGLIRKVRRTAKQATLTPSARRTNMRNAFRGNRYVDLAGATVLLVDDVMTTGATADACGRALKSIGAGRILVAAMARGLGQKGIAEDPHADA